MAYIRQSGGEIPPPHDYPLRLRSRHNGAMNPLPLPSCCSEPVEHWPLPRPLAGTRLVSTRFDPERLAPDDFAHCAIPPLGGAAKRQTEHLAGRLCARQALLGLTGIPDVPAVGADRAPQWPAGTVGSITHSDGWAAALVGHASLWRGLGLDAETLLQPARSERLARQILTPGEQERGAALPLEQRAWLVTLVFSLKESLFKALYPLVRQRFYFQDAELLEWSADGQARLRLLTPLAADWPAGAELEGQFAQLEERLLTLVGIGR